MLRSDRQYHLLLTLTITALGFAAATGRLESHSVADTPSYLNYPFDSLDSALLSIRTPVYPIFLKLVDATVGLSYVPTIQWLIACVAAWVLAIELGRWSFPKTSTWAAAFAVLFSCTFLDNQSTISTDAVAASAGIVAVACTLKWIRCGRRLLDGLMIVAIVFIAIMIRPAYLSLVPWVLLAGTAIFSPDTRADKPFLARLFSSAIVAAAVTTLIISWMVMRLIVVEDFGLLPFGHQNLAGLTVQFVSDDELLEIAEDGADASQEMLIESILKERDQALAQGWNLVEGGRLPTMTMEGQWNEQIYQVVVPAADEIYSGDPVASHRAIGQLNRSIISAHPERYTRWLALGTRRAIWGVLADMAMNPVYLFFAGCFAVWWVINLLRKQPWRNNRNYWTTVRLSSGTNLLGVIALSYALVMIGFVILTSPPLGRFADAGAIFIPAWLAMGALERFAWSNNSV